MLLDYAVKMQKSGQGRARESGHATLSQRKRTSARLARDEVIRAEEIAVRRATDDIESARLYREEKGGLGV